MRRRWTGHEWHPGDLVKAEFVGTVYYGIILRSREDGADVFLGNGLEVALAPHEFTLMPMHLASDCVANFAEIIKCAAAAAPTHPGSSGTGD